MYYIYLATLFISVARQYLLAIVCNGLEQSKSANLVCVHKSMNKDVMTSVPLSPRIASF